jgi:DNA-binding NarL/FixJ family response regulator
MPKLKPIKLLVLDQCSTLFQEIEAGLSCFGNVECLHASTEEEAREHLKSDLIRHVLLESCSPNGAGLIFLRYLRKTHPDVVPVIISAANDQKHVYAAFAAGAHGFLFKPMPTADLIHQLEGWFVGIVPISPCVAAKLINWYCNSADESINHNDSNEFTGFAGFSKREGEVMSLLVSGITPNAIAKQLGISYSTVATHVKRIYSKLKVSNRTAAIKAITHLKLAN